MRILVKLYVAVSLIGAVHSIRRGKPARLFGLHFPGSVAAQALTIGTAISAPPTMLAALLVAESRGRRDIVRILSMMFICGVLGEADTPTALRRPRADPLGTACVALEVLLPAAIFAGSLRLPGPACR